MNTQTVFSKWKELFRDKNLRIKMIITLILFVITMMFFKQFVLYVEARDGVFLQDPLMKFFNAIDFNIPIFIIIYGSIFTSFIMLLKYPKYFMIAIQTYMLMIIFRTIGMYITPLDVPRGVINLQDPVVFMLGTGQPITKDLFFSGHTATMSILFLTARNKILKRILFAGTILIVVMIFLQKAHYTLDILAAPFVAVGSYRMIMYMNHKLFHNEEIDKKVRLDTEYLNFH